MSLFFTPVSPRHFRAPLSGRDALFATHEGFLPLFSDPPTVFRSPVRILGFFFTKNLVHNFFGTGSSLAMPLKGDTSPSFPFLFFPIIRLLFFLLSDCLRVRVPVDYPRLNPLAFLAFFLSVLVSPPLPFRGQSPFFLELEVSPTVFFFSHLFYQQGAFIPCLFFS